MIGRDGDHRLAAGGWEAWGERARRCTLRLEALACGLYGSDPWRPVREHEDSDRTSYYRLMVRARAAENDLFAALVRP